MEKLKNDTKTNRIAAFFHINSSKTHIKSYPLENKIENLLVNVCEPLLNVYSPGDPCLSLVLLYFALINNVSILSSVSGMFSVGRKSEASPSSVCK